MVGDIFAPVAVRDPGGAAGAANGDPGVGAVKALPQSRDLWPADARADFDERAGIMEHDGRIPRDQAERQAEADVRRRWCRG